jgi:hypothetical protein
VHDAPIVLVLQHSRGIWRITRDGAFYGDYRSKANGTEAAQSAAAAIRLTGRSVTIVLAPSKDAQ